MPVMGNGNLRIWDSQDEQLAANVSSTSSHEQNQSWYAVNIALWWSHTSLSPASPDVKEPHPHWNYAGEDEE
eukprot:3478725-Amphidinium_carterae.1